MKKLAVIAAILSVIFVSASAFSYPKTLDGKLGTGYASDPEKFGWQLNFAYLTELDPFFALGFEPGFYWAKWDRKVGSSEIGGVPANLKADTNAYLFPLLVDAQIRLPNLQQKYYVIPYLTVGLGYSFMILDFTTPAYEDQVTNERVSSKSDTKLFRGFTWQVMLGVSFDPGYSSRIKFLAEVGYRGAKMEKKNLEVDMSGVVINIGVKFPLGDAEPPAKAI